MRSAADGESDVEAPPYDVDALEALEVNRRRTPAPASGRRPRPRRRARAAAAHPAAGARGAAQPVRGHRLHPAHRRDPQARQRPQGDVGGLGRRRRAAHRGARPVRDRRPDHRLHPRSDGDPLRGRARPRGQGREGHGAEPQHRLRRRLGRRPHPVADPRQVRDRRRDPERRRRDRLPRRRPPLAAGPQRPPPAHRRPRQGRRGRLRGRQPGEDAAPAGRRRHRLRQVQLHQLDGVLAAHPGDARRGTDDHDRPEAGRADRLRGHPAPDHPDHHQPEEGRRGAAVGRPRDGPALRRPGRTSGSVTSTTSTARSRVARSRLRPAASGCWRRTRIWWWSSTSWPT